jgi:membrane protease YdiL (CAAX protease family)
VVEPAGTPITHEPVATQASGPAALRQPADPAHALGRFRVLQIASILLAVGGIAAIWLAASVGPLLDTGGSGLPVSDRAALALSLAIGGAVAFVVGLVGNAARAIVVRERLPDTRYRGPSVIVLLVIGSIAGIAFLSPHFVDLQSFLEGEAVSLLGALAILTSTQLGLVAVAIAFVALPNALAGISLLPRRGAGLSVVTGLVVAAPAWIGSVVISYLLTRLLELMGRRPEPGAVEQAIGLLDPTVLIVAIVLVAPIAEELFFRGVVFNAWLREYGTWPAFLGSAALFAVIHADASSGDALIASMVTVVPVIFGLGLALAFVYQRTGSLLASMALHAGFNGISLTLALLARLYGWELPT